MTRTFATLLLGALLVAIGLGAGWLAARQGAVTPSDEGGDAGARALSPQALERMGVTVGEARKSDFVRSVNVQAVVADAPLNARPLTALLGGVVTEVHVRPGDVVGAGDAVVTLARDPIPLPSLTLTNDLLQAVSEDLHAAISEFRTAVKALEIAREELARIRQFGDVLAAKTRIELEYEIARGEQQVQNRREELERHGLTDEEIDGVAKGGEPPANLSLLWKRALEHNGVWTAEAEAAHRALPPATKRLPWAVAALGELAAAGLVTDDLSTAIESEPAFAARFVEVASLLLQGNTVEKARLLAKAGALEPVAPLRAPRDAPDWDVTDVSVRAAQRVAAGAQLAALHDSRRMWLLLEPVGAELALVAQAVRAGTAVEARPLIDGAGPVLRDVYIDRMSGERAIAVCGNEPVAQRRSRTWALRAGLRYLVRVPVEELEARFVLPAGAVTDLGVEKMVFVQDGGSFRAQVVHVEYSDEEVAVVADDGSLYEGDPIALSGAFALGLALESEGGGGDGHPHPHPH